MKATRGMRDIPTVQGSTNRVEAKSREQGITDLARLEHERARLERELNMWLENQKRAEQRLKIVHERITLLQQGLYGSPVESRSASNRGGLGDDGEQEPRSWHRVSLEY